ncbi:MAG: type II toxin-antitoxin system Phd/YefM family antitoxin [Clostridia bacterium]|nr:type II toxin-antitoxin system Phd/YefM family antitoxin [Clostridia bacterium]
MNINTNTIVSMTEANQNFSKVARIAERSGEAVIFKNNKPKFIVLDIDKAGYIDLSDDEKIDIVAARVLKKFRPAFEELAK